MRTRLADLYVEQTRDPSHYPKAEGALRRSLTLRPEGDAATFTALGAARHDYKTAERVLQKMLDLRPGVVSFTRASLLLERRGHPDRTTDALSRAAEIAATPHDAAFCRYHLGDLAWKQGQPKQALAEYEQALAAVPDHPTP